MNQELADLLTRARGCLESGALTDAMRLCESALTIDKHSAAALAMYAEAARRADDYEAALPALQELAALTPQQAGVFLALGRVLARLQRDDEAIAAFETCLSIDENNPEALRGLGNACARVGNTQMAVEAMQRAIAFNQRDTAAHYQLTTLIHAEADDPRAARLEKLFDDGGFSDREFSRLAFAIARILDQQANYDEAFRWFQTANALRRKDSDFDSEADEAWIQRAIRTFDASFFEQRKTAGFSSSQPVFIVGLPRSGSTLLEQVLASHPDIHGAGELMLLPDTLAGLGAWLGSGERLPEAAASLNPTAWQDLGQRYSSALDKFAPGKSRIVDKQLFNYTLVGFIRLMLPQARILHASRHPMATCWSCYATAFRQDRGFTSDLEDLGKSWRLYRQLMDHWHATLPDFLLEVHYEDMLDDLEGTIRSVLDFIGLPWSDKCLEFYNTRRTVVTASKTQVRQQIYQSSRDHWRHYEAHLGPLHVAMQTDDDQ